MNHSIEILGTFIFAIAMIHTFLASQLVAWSHHFPKGSMREAVLHLLGEVEIVFGFWSAFLLLGIGILESPAKAIDFHESLNFTEPIFVFCIMVVAATGPILLIIEKIIFLMSSFLTGKKWIPMTKEMAEFFVILTVGPLSGSLITEPAAMTVTALLLSARLRSPGGMMIYHLLATLFVNVSVGGSLTNFAAPPILMVASKWGWSTSDVFILLGDKAVAAVIINSAIFVFWNRKVLAKSVIHQSMTQPESHPETSSKMQSESRSEITNTSSKEIETPFWISVVHFIFLAGIILTAHHPSICAGTFLFFVGFTMVTRKFQTELRIKQSLLVAFFLAGIVTFGPLQSWWLQPLLNALNSQVLGGVAVLLTAVTDNAALTYLGSQIPDLSDSSKYYLVAGALAGGGLTIIANAPNAAGYSVLQRFFPESLSATQLLKAALIPTAIACLFLSIY